MALIDLWWAWDEGRILYPSWASLISWQFSIVVPHLSQLRFRLGAGNILVHCCLKISSDSLVEGEVQGLILVMLCGNELGRQEGEQQIGQLVCKSQYFYLSVLSQLPHRVNSSLLVHLNIVMKLLS